MTPARERLAELAAKWRVSVEEVITGSGQTVFGFGRRDGRAVVLKVNPAEPHAGPVIEAFAGRGVVEIFEFAGDAVLVERAIPGRSLTDVVRHHGERSRDTSPGSGDRADEV